MRRIEDGIAGGFGRGETVSITEGWVRRWNSNQCMEIFANEGIGDIPGWLDLHENVQ